MATKKLTTAVTEMDEPVTAVSKKFEPEDLIDCRSITSGGLYIEGNRSKMLYTWADYGDVVGVEYRDLIYMVRTRGNRDIYNPRIIIEDEDFISQNKELSELYESLYSKDDLREIFNLSPAKMKAEIENLPIGVKDAIKGIAATMVDSHALDSVQKIKVIDEIFGTNLLLTLSQE